MGKNQRKTANLHSSIPVKSARWEKGEIGAERPNQPNSTTHVPEKLTYNSLSDLDGIREALRQGGPGFKFMGSDFLAIQKPAVYLWIRDGTILYVGIATQGGRRIFYKHHKIKHVQPEDEIIVWSMPTLAAARKAEKIILANVRPPMNLHGVFDQRTVNRMADRMGITPRTARILAGRLVPR